MRVSETSLYTSPDFETFWVRYRALHARRSTRVLHLIATGSALSLAAAGCATRNPWLFVAAPVVDYGIAQLSHRACEGNRTTPARRLPWHVRAELRLARETLGELAGRARRGSLRRAARVGARWRGRSSG